MNIILEIYVKNGRKGMCLKMNGEYVKEEKLSIGDREFKCVKCGFIDDRDANASKNIYKIA